VGPSLKILGTTRMRRIILWQSGQVGELVVSWTRRTIGALEQLSAIVIA
jgi:hypothetical protein